jgi:hypothetical protein
MSLFGGLGGIGGASTPAPAAGGLFGVGSSPAPAPAPATASLFGVAFAKPSSVSAPVGINNQFQPTAGPSPASSPGVGSFRFLGASQQTSTAPAAASSAATSSSGAFSGGFFGAGGTTFQGTNTFAAPQGTKSEQTGIVNSVCARMKDQSLDSLRFMEYQAKNGSTQPSAAGAAASSGTVRAIEKVFFAFIVCRNLAHANSPQKLIAMKSVDEALEVCVVFIRHILFFECCLRCCDFR